MVKITVAHKQQRSDVRQLKNAGRDRSDVGFVVFYDACKNRHPIPQHPHLGLSDTMKILLVEDSRGTRKIIRSMLQAMGYDDILEAAHGGDAWDRLRTNKVDSL